MFEVGFTELILICALALIVLGPERLPKLAQQLGRWIGRARAMARQLREQLDQEVNFQEEAARRAHKPAAASPAPDVDEFADPHDGRSHRDANEPDAQAEPAAQSEPPTTPAAEPQPSNDTPQQNPHERSGA